MVEGRVVGATVVEVVDVVVVEVVVVVVVEAVVVVGTGAAAPKRIVEKSFTTIGPNSMTVAGSTATPSTASRYRMVTFAESTELLVRTRGRLPVPSTVSRITHWVVLVNGVGTVAAVPVRPNVTMAVQVPSKVAGDAVQKRLTRKPVTFDGTVFDGKPSSTRRSFDVNAVEAGTMPGTVCALAAGATRSKAQASEATPRTLHRRVGWGTAFRGRAIKTAPFSGVGDYPPSLTRRARIAYDEVFCWVF